MMCGFLLEMVGFGVVPLGVGWVMGIALGLIEVVEWGVIQDMRQLEGLNQALC